MVIVKNQPTPVIPQAPPLLPINSAARLITRFKSQQTLEVWIPGMTWIDIIGTLKELQDFSN